MVDVYYMVVNGFKSTLTVIIYLIGMAFLFLHVSHGFQSLFQTIGLSNDKSLPVMGMVSKLVGFVLLVGYISIPLLIVAGLIKI
jgi:succinate dehydrogenase / fumarate reductase cytochrome b subunit